MMPLRGIGKEVRANAGLAGPIILVQVAQMAMGFTDTLMAGRLSPMDLGAIAIGVNLWILPYLFSVGLFMAVSSMTAHFFGAARLADIRDLLGQALLIGFAATCMLFTALVLFLFPRHIVELYTQDAEVQGLALKLLLLAAFYQLSDGIQISANGALRGLKDTFLPMAITLAVYWGFGLPLSWYLGFARSIGPQGLWLGLLAALTLAAVLLVWRFLRLSSAFPPAPPVAATG